MKNSKKSNDYNIYFGNVLDVYYKWERPTVIISDGPYGINGFDGDLDSYTELSNWYEPHIKAWSQRSTPITTLWFWNTEIGWATVHKVLEKYGWKYVTCCIWNKGIGHVAGNVNTKTIRQLPVVSEVCVQYVKIPKFTVNNCEMSMKEWLRYEWSRTGIPFSKTNAVCNVKNAATRKYFTKCHLWYMPPAEMFEKIQIYANKNGKPEGRPYFSTDGVKPLTKDEWERQRSKFYCPIGITNVWNEPQLRTKERIKIGAKSVHLNQKPISLFEKIISMTSDEGDVVWDVFGGTGTGIIACKKLHRRCYTSEINQQYFNVLRNRLNNIL